MIIQKSESIRNEFTGLPHTETHKIFDEFSSDTYLGPASSFTTQLQAFIASYIESFWLYIYLFRWFSTAFLGCFFLQQGIFFPVRASIISFERTIVLRRYEILNKMYYPPLRYHLCILATYAATLLHPRGLCFIGYTYRHDGCTNMSTVHIMNLLLHSSARVILLPVFCIYFYSQFLCDVSFCQWESDLAVDPKRTSAFFFFCMQTIFFMMIKVMDVVAVN